MKKQETINLNTEWGIGEDAFRYICDLIVAHNLHTMIEFGSGASTVGWLLSIPDLSIISFEHDHQFFINTKYHLECLNLSNRVQLCYAPLQRQWIGGRRFNSYSRPHLLNSCDIIVIDGPPHYTRRGREACLYFVYNLLEIGGFIILDDAARPDEQEMIANWLSIYPESFQFDMIHIGHGLAVLRKVKHISQPQLSGRALWDFYKLKMQQFKFMTKVAMKHTLGNHLNGD